HTSLDCDWSSDVCSSDLQQLRRELSIQKLFNKEITSHIAISDADVTAFYNANKAGFNLAEPQVHMAQILVTPFPDPNVRNLKNEIGRASCRERVEMWVIS